MRIYVREGDTLWGLSLLFDVPFRLVLDSNPGLQPEMLDVGQPVEIPGYRWNDYRIRAGDTLWRIAAANGISVHLLLAANPALNAYSLQIGDTVRVPFRVTERIVNPKREYSSEAMRNDVNALAELYPFMRTGSFGRSVMGKELTEIQIGAGGKTVHANASIHANEWITTPVLMAFLNDYLLATTNSSDMKGIAVYPYYETATLSLVPMVNPDGVDLVVSGLPREEPYRSEALAINEGSYNFDGWKANIRGVDLNKQFPALWERDAAQGPQRPAPRDYSGTAPLTEPESQALADLTRQSGFRRVLAFHTQGKVLFWGFEGLEPPESERLAAEFAAVSGYEAVRYVDSTAGYKDWFIQDWRLPGFTIELGEGTNPLPLSQFDELFDAASAILLAALYM